MLRREGEGQAGSWLADRLLAIIACLGQQQLRLKVVAGLFHVMLRGGCCLPKQSWWLRLGRAAARRVPEGDQHHGDGCKAAAAEHDKDHLNAELVHQVAAADLTGGEGVGEWGVGEWGNGGWELGLPPWCPTQRQPIVAAARSSHRLGVQGGWVSLGD